MSGFDALWGDELTENDVAECLELETQASQVTAPTFLHLRGNAQEREDRAWKKDDRGNMLAQIPRMMDLRQSKDEPGINTSSSPSTSISTSSSSSSLNLSRNQRLLKQTVKSLPEIPQSFAKDKNQSSTTDWLRKELEKHKKHEAELKHNQQTLEGEVKLLRERNNTYQQQIVIAREKAENEFKLKEEKYLAQIKELKRETESTKIQLVMKSKESESNKERYLELKNVSVVEPNFADSDTPLRERVRTGVQSSSRRESLPQVDSDEDIEGLDILKKPSVKRARKELLPDLKAFSCDELIKVMDGPRQGITSPTKRLSEQVKPILEIDLTESPYCSSISTTPAKPMDESVLEEPTVTASRYEAEPCADLSSKFPWCKQKGYHIGVHSGRLLISALSEKIYTLADPEIKIIVPPIIDFDPSNVLKMDSSDLQYLEDIERGEKIWGVDLKTMYETTKPPDHVPSPPKDKDAEAMETVKTILGSQMCERSPDQSKTEEERTSPDREDVEVTEVSKPGEKSMLLTSLEPIHVHLKALTKLQNWHSSIDLLSAIIKHLTSMINELHERLCDPRIPDQLKDQFYNNEFATGSLFMNGPYHSHDPLSHSRWTERERYVELRRGLAVASILSSLSRDAANLILDPQLLVDISNNNEPSLAYTLRNNLDLAESSWSKNQSYRKMMSKADELLSKLSCMKEEGSEGGSSNSMERLSERMSGSHLTSDVPQSNIENSASLTTSFVDHFALPIQHEKVIELLKICPTAASCKANEDEEKLSETSNPSTINADEVMDLEDVDAVDEDVTSSAPKSMDEVDHDSFKAWYDLYTQRRFNFAAEESTSDTNSKFNRLLDPQMTDLERKELTVYLKRRKLYKEFYKCVAEKGSIWVPDKNYEGGGSSVENVKNLYDFENKISTMNSTITSDELASMMPGPFCPANENPAVDADLTVKTQEDSPVDNEWRVNSLQKNEEDPNFTKVEEVKKVDSDNWLCFEKFKTNVGDKDKTASEAASNVSKNKPQTLKNRKHSLAPMKKKGEATVTTSSGSLNQLNMEMEMEVEMLYGKAATSKISSSKSKGSTVSVNVMTPFSPENRFPESLSEDDQRPDTLWEYLSSLPSLDDADFEETFKEAYSHAEQISARCNLKLKPYKKQVIHTKLEQMKKDLQDEANKKNEMCLNQRKRSESGHAKAGSSRSGSLRHDEESDAIISMLNDEALKYSLNKNIKSFDKKRGKLNLLDGIYEIVSAVNFSRLTLVFYPLLSSCVSLMDSLFQQSFSNDYFNRDSFVLIMKILNEVTCCQPPPDILEKIISVLLYAIRFPEIVDCLCKKRSNLVSLVTKKELCFFKGVCMLQPLCYLVSVVSQTKYPGYWNLSFSFTKWLRLLYQKHRLFLEPWYPPSQVCNCVPVLHNALFTTLTKATSFLANQGEVEDGLRRTLESIVVDGIGLCEVLIDIDPCFVQHLDRFQLYAQFLTTARDMHYDTLFSPKFILDSHHLRVVECLINANEMLASKTRSSTCSGNSDIVGVEESRAHFNRVFNPNHIFLNCADRYDQQC